MSWNALTFHFPTSKTILLGMPWGFLMFIHQGLIPLLHFESQSFFHKIKMIFFRGVLSHQGVHPKSSNLSFVHLLSKPTRGIGFPHAPPEVPPLPELAELVAPPAPAAPAPPVPLGAGAAASHGGGLGERQAPRAEAWASHGQRCRCTWSGALGTLRCVLPW